MLRRRRCFELPRFLSSSGSPVPLLSLPRSLGEEARVALACAAPAQPWNGTAKKKRPCWIRPADMDLDTLGVAYVRASATFHGLVVDFSRATSGGTQKIHPVTRRQRTARIRPHHTAATGSRSNRLCLWHHCLDSRFVSENRATHLPEYQPADGLLHFRSSRNKCE